MEELEIIRCDLMRDDYERKVVRLIEEILKIDGNVLKPQNELSASTELIGGAASKDVA